MSTPSVPPPSTLDDPIFKSALDALHRQAKRDRLLFLRAMPRLALARLTGGEAVRDRALRPYLKDAYISLSAEQGRFLYLTARAIGARRAVEFGTSFGISIHYLAAAVKDNGGGVAIGTEMERAKWERACANIAAAGLADYAQVMLGDALQTLADVPHPVDIVLLDGWKDLYVPVLELLTPKLRHGSVILADNIYRPSPAALAPYVERMQSGRHGFASMTLPLGSGMEYSVFVGGGPQQLRAISAKPITESSGAPAT